MSKYAGYKPADFDRHNQDAASRFFIPFLAAMVIGAILFVASGVAISLLSGVTFDMI